VLAQISAADPQPVDVRVSPDDVLTDDDAQVALWALYELSYRGFDEVDPDHEWSPALLTTRAALEGPFEEALWALTDPAVDRVLEDQDTLSGQIAAVLDDVDEDPGLAQFLQREATEEHYREFLVQRSIYHLKESDPHAFAVPRLRGRPKVALAELQYDEFGAGVPSRLHSALFADALAAAGLSNAYGEYVDRAYAEVLAVNNAMSLFGLHRRLRGACMGHLAAFEMTSSFPSRRYAMGAERLGFDEPVAAYFDEHVEADAVHEQIAARDICQELARAEPDLIDDIAFGAAACVLLEGEASKVLIDGWDAEDQVAM
jgi:hypothetical protein